MLLNLKAFASSSVAKSNPIPIQRASVCSGASSKQQVPRYLQNITYRNLLTSTRWLRSTPSCSTPSLYKHNVKTYCRRFLSKTKDNDLEVEERKNTLEEIEQHLGIKTLYTNGHLITATVDHIIDSFQSSLQPGQQLSDQVFTVSGRIASKRESSKKLLFYTIEQNGQPLQIMCNLRHFNGSEERFSFLHQNMRRGDIIAVKGFVGKTKAGELSIYPGDISLIAPCHYSLPSRNGLKDPESRYRQRYLDILANASSKEVFVKRAKTISALRKFLDSRGFIEVDTPVLSPTAGGALATPFKTHSKSLGSDLHLRIAPELYLKQLVIGGMEKVYEIGKQFRNEGIDPSHNPEFTTCEFYQAYANYEMLMTTTEELLATLATEANGTTKVTVVHRNGSAQEIDFAGPYQRIDIVPALEKSLGAPLPDLNKPDCTEKLLVLCKKHHIHCPAPHTTSRLLDKLISHFLEPICTKPTFLCGHPLVMSPLAKESETRPGISERFELFVGGFEICNAYSELNDPREQRRRFSQQTQDKALGDEEIPPADEQFCTALEYGMPPTAGWGLGIDRLVMLLTNSQNIKEVIAFPIMKMHLASDVNHDTPPK